jgi:type II secretory pathway pseudopilin PulG
MKRLTLVEMLSLLALTVAVLAVVLPVMGTWRERPLIEAMRANLRNLAAAQESYFYDFRGYSGDLEGLRRTGFTPSDGVRLLIREATRAGWSAIASHPETRIQCFLFVRDAARAGSAAVAGTVHCS